MIGILGRSGMGKSVVLKMIAGLITPDQGKITYCGTTFYDSQQKINVPPQKRSAGYLFQNYALFPTMTVGENIGISLTGKKIDKQQKIKELLDRFSIQFLADKMPQELSGGQQQRVALARIFAQKPNLLLLDEPFSALDSFKKEQMIEELKNFLADYEGSVVYVSHDKEEIYQLCEQLMVIDHGMVAATGSPQEVFADPKTVRTAQLMGCKNFSRIKKISRFQLYAIDWDQVLTTASPLDDSIQVVGIYSHHITWNIAEGREENRVKVSLEKMEDLPFETRYVMALENQQKLFARVPKIDQSIFHEAVYLPKDHLLLLTSWKKPLERKRGFFVCRCYASKFFM